MGALDLYYNAQQVTSLCKSKIFLIQALCEFVSVDMKWSLAGVCLKQILRSLRESLHEDTSSRVKSSLGLLCIIALHVIVIRLKKGPVP